jgi:hypothetical protein
MSSPTLLSVIVHVLWRIWLRRRSRPSSCTLRGRCATCSHSRGRCGCSGSSRGGAFGGGLGQRLLLNVLDRLRGLCVYEDEDAGLRTGLDRPKSAVLWKSAIQHTNLNLKSLVNELNSGRDTQATQHGTSFDFFQHQELSTSPLKEIKASSKASGGRRRPINDVAGKAKAGERLARGHSTADTAIPALFRTGTDFSEAPPKSPCHAPCTPRSFCRLVRRAATLILLSTEESLGKRDSCRETNSPRAFTRSANAASQHAIAIVTHRTWQGFPSQTDTSQPPPSPPSLSPQPRPRSQPAPRPPPRPPPYPSAPRRPRRRQRLQVSHRTPRMAETAGPAAPGLRPWLLPCAWRVPWPS